MHSAALTLRCRVGQRTSVILSSAMVPRQQGHCAPSSLVKLALSYGILNDFDAVEFSMISMQCSSFFLIVQSCCSKLMYCYSKMTKNLNDIPKFYVHMVIALIK